MSQQNKLSKNSVPMIMKAFEVLEGFREKPEGLTYMELIERFSKISKISLYRILCSLESLGFLEKDEQTNRYELGAKFIELGRLTEKRQDLIRLLQPTMQDILERFEENVNLAKIQAGELIYLKTIEGRHPVRVIEFPNRTEAIYCSAVGKAILTFMPEDEQRKIIAGLKFVKYTSFTVSSKAQLRQELDEIAEKGYALDNEENLAGVRCVAVPILDSKGHASVGLSVTGPISRMTVAQAKKVGTYLAKRAHELSEQIYGYRHNGAPRARAVDTDVAVGRG
jgi:IclR family KDG regulon transcriptional repressor